MGAPEVVLPQVATPPGAVTPASADRRCGCRAVGTALEAGSWMTYRILLPPGAAAALLLVPSGRPMEDVAPGSLRREHAGAHRPVGRQREPARGPRIRPIATA
jgi:hypothetical protein